MWRKLPDFRVEKKAQNPVTSLAVMVFSVPRRPQLSKYTANEENADMKNAENSENAADSRWLALMSVALGDPHERVSERTSENLKEMPFC